jgi:hypothetical protein
MTLSREKQKNILIALFAVLALLIVYRIFSAEKPKTAPLTYTRGAMASSAVRPGLAARAAGTDPLSVFLQRREEKFPGVARDIFRMENPARKPKAVPKPVTAPTPTLPPVPVKTPEELAADVARADLSKFRFLGYLTDKDNTLFLSKDGENFVVKSGDKVLKNYMVKEAEKDHVVLFDTITRVEVRVELSGGEQSPQHPQVQQQRYR